MDPSKGDGNKEQLEDESDNKEEEVIIKKNK